MILRHWAFVAFGRVKQHGGARPFAAAGPDGWSRSVARRPRSAPSG